MSNLTMDSSGFRLTGHRWWTGWSKPGRAAPEDEMSILTEWLTGVYHARVINLQIAPDNPRQEISPINPIFTCPFI